MARDTLAGESKFKFQVFPSRQDRKTNSFVLFLGEVMTRQFLFRDILTFNKVLIYFCVFPCSISNIVLDFNQILAERLT